MLWGAGGIYYKLIHQYEGLASDNFLLVDVNEELQGLSICKKEVLSPSVMMDKNIETVVITALSRKDDIYVTLRSNYPSVKNILIPDIDITNNGIIPVLRTINKD